MEAVQTNETLADVQAQFQLFYGPDIAKMTEWEHQRYGRRGVGYGRMITNIDYCMTEVEAKERTIGAWLR